MGEANALEALTRVTAYAIDQQAFAPLLVNRPAMAEELGLEPVPALFIGPPRRTARSPTQASRARLPQGNPEDLPRQASPAPVIPAALLQRADLAYRTPR